MEEKFNLMTENIKKYIKSNIGRKGCVKQYLVRNNYQYNIIRKFCEENNLRCDRIVDDKNYQNNLTDINASYNSGCCCECDIKRSYDHIKVNRLMIKVYY